MIFFLLFADGVSYASVRCEEFFALEGVYSGTFDPPTKAHAAIIRGILNTGVSKLHVLVNASGEKNFKASTDERIAMLKASLGGFESRLDFQSVLQEDKQAAVTHIEDAAGTIYGFIGEDSFHKLPPEALNDKRRILRVIPRPDSKTGSASQVSASTAFEIPGIANVSSSRVRSQLAEGRGENEDLEPPVLDYIHKNFLYKTLPDFLLPVQKGLFEVAFQTYLHELHVIMPTLKLEGISAPPFEVLQSRNSWADNFINRVSGSGAVPREQLPEFREKSLELITTLNQGIRYARMPFLREVPASPGPVPKILSVTKVQLKPVATYQEAHSLNLREYIQQRFPEPLQKFIFGQNAEIYLHDGVSRDALAYHASMGFTRAFEIQMPRGNANTRNFILYNPQSGKVRFIVPNLGSDDRFAQVAGQIAFFTPGRKVNFVRQVGPAHTVEFNDFGKTLRFGSQDHLLIGFKSVVQKYFQQHPEWVPTDISMGSLQLTMYTHTKSGQRIVNARNVYGDEMKEVLNAFYEKGVRSYTLMGTAGGIAPEMRIGDVLIPDTVSEDRVGVVSFQNKNAWAKLSENSHLRIHKNVKHGWVQTIVEESVRHLKLLLSKGVQSVDIEGRYMAEFLKAKPDTRGQTLFVVSDNPLGRLNYGENNATLPEVFRTVTEILSSIPPGQMAAGPTP